MTMAPSIIAAWLDKPSNGQANSGTCPGNGDPEVEQAPHDPLAMAFQLTQLKVKATIEQDDRHR